MEDLCEMAERVFIFFTKKLTFGYCGPPVHRGLYFSVSDSRNVSYVKQLSDELYVL